MKRQTNNNMKKYIVEAPEPREGQSASSGGIRERGKITVQYKNPVPYEDTPPSIPDETVFYNRSRLKSYAAECGSNILEMLWDELGKPIIKAKLNQLGNRIVDKNIFSDPPQSKTKHNKIIDAKCKEVIPCNNSSEKIILFPRKSIV